MKKRSTTKLLITFLFINFTLIQLFVGWVTIRSFDLALAIGTTPDFTPLVTVVGAIVGEVISYAIYALKSVKENCEGGITYLQAKNRIETDEDCSG